MTITDDYTKQILDSLKELARRVRRLETLEFPVSLDGSGSPAFSFGKILLIRHDGGGVTIHEVTADGLNEAINKAEPQDGIWIPPCTIVGDFTFPADVTVQAYAEKSIIDGTIYLSSGSLVKDLSIIQSKINELDAYGFVGPASGTATIEECYVEIVHSGDGDIYGITQELPDGEIDVYDSNVTVLQISTYQTELLAGVYYLLSGLPTVPGGNAYAVGVDGGANVFVKDCVLHAESVDGVGYAGFVWAGTLEADGGKAYGSTSRFGKA